MRKIKLKPRQLGKIEIICTKLEDLAVSLGIALDGSIYEDKINGLAEEIRSSFN